MNILGIVRGTVQDRKVEIRAGRGCLLIPGTVMLVIGFLPIAAFIASGSAREQVLQDSPGVFFAVASRSRS